MRSKPEPCVLSDLPPDQCWHCRGDDDSSIPSPQRDGVLSLAPPLTTADIAATFVARFPGRCSRCDALVVPGCSAGWTSDRDLVCEGCLP